jgi:hypothetical protein
MLHVLNVPMHDSRYEIVEEARVKVAMEKTEKKDKNCLITDTILQLSLKKIKGFPQWIKSNDLLQRESQKCLSIPPNP